MFDRILIPVDGSDPARDAAQLGIDLAAEHDATVHGLYVVEPVAVAEGGAGQVLDAMEAAGEEIVSELAEQAEAEGLTAVTAVETGVAHRKILEYTDANDIDLMVVGTHGRTGLGRYLLGSVTEKLVRISDVPVLTVRPDDEEE
ncbi:universal stress protein [Natronomonas sp. F2-12]|jgi:nucleotide-binding universal stress UspA family protein|uniref:Universal stress protein n=1 Tax=Natronomonas aquatica TaxID=2841590 RepID=A0A9R1D7P1_9EURY|nr:universal stress protein [Natronomonas aquatica]MCQ4333865.1 universal stress protein [Natronomonas aquatica]